MIKQRFLIPLVLAIGLLSLLANCHSIKPTEPTEAPAEIFPTATSTVTDSAAVADPSIERQVTNVIAFARLYGVVRYFHPSDQVADVYDWSRFLVNGVEQVRDASTSDALAQRLDQIFDPLAPTVQIMKEGDLPAQRPEILAGEPLLMWQHYGVAADSTYNLYKSERITAASDERPDTFHDPQAPYRQLLGDGLVAYVPLTLYVVNGQTQPASAVGILGTHASPNSSQAGYLAGVIEFWAVTHHFYPYFDAIDTDWETSFQQALTEILLSNEISDWELALSRLTADLRDGHAYLNTPGNFNLHSPNVLLGWVEEQVVVLEAADEAKNALQAGDIVLAVNGTAAVDLLQDKIDLLSSPAVPYKRHLGLTLLLAGERDTSVELTVERANGHQDTMILARTTNHYNRPVQKRPENFSEIAPDVYYIDLETVEPHRFASRLEELRPAHGIIFDMRGYPAVRPDFMALLIEETISTAPFLIPQTLLPNQENTVFDDVAWTIEPDEHGRISENIVFLTDARAISYAETLMAMVAHYEIGDIVGESTAGTNGNVNTIDLASGHRINWTGMLVQKHDGSQHHGVGIQPTVPVIQMLTDLRNGVDTQLQVAIQLIEDGE